MSIPTDSSSDHTDPQSRNSSQSTTSIYDNYPLNASMKTIHSKESAASMDLTSVASNLVPKSFLKNYPPRHPLATYTISSKEASFAGV